MVQRRFTTRDGWQIETVCGVKLPEPRTEEVTDALDSSTFPHLCADCCMSVGLVKLKTEE